MEFQKIRRIHPSWTACELMLQHSSRKTGSYWIDSAVAFYRGAERVKYLYLGAGTKNDSALAIERILSYGFKQAGSRLNQEWEHIRFVRESDPEADENP
ncbi:MAG: hypothetical protein E4G99_11340 [Anaerolineales bacterium]|nr:MAG: hypothetical protein E4G99_11340 [Anaerolineales bacterium]